MAAISQMAAPPDPVPILAGMARSPRAIHNFGCGSFPLSEDVSLRFIAAGFVLVYFLVMGAIIFAPFAHYGAVLEFVLGPAGLVGAALLAVGRFYPLCPPELNSHERGPRATPPTS